MIDFELTNKSRCDICKNYLIKGDIICCDNCYSNLSVEIYDLKKEVEQLKAELKKQVVGE